MPRIPGKSKEKITFTCDHNNFRLLNEAISKEEFSSMSEAINEAIRLYFENKGNTTIEELTDLAESLRQYIIDQEKEKLKSKDEFKEWLLSDEGKLFVREILLEADRSLQNEKQ